MAKYSSEQKAEALNRIHEGTSVTTISAELNISPATLFKWKKEANRDKPSQPMKKKTATKPVTTRKATPKVATTNNAAIEAADALLKEDDKAERIRQLEAEIAVLRDANAKLASDNDIFRKAFIALKEG